MFMQTLIFWYVISKAVENIIIDKSIIIKEIINNSTVLTATLYNYTHSSEYIIAHNKSGHDASQRTEYNYNLTKHWMTVPFSIVVGILSVGTIYTIYIHCFTEFNNLKFDKAHVIILLLVFYAFLAEIAVIFILIMRYVYISDMEVIIFIANSGILDTNNINVDITNIINKLLSKYNHAT